jgi:hypothetical protein
MVKMDGNLQEVKKRKVAINDLETFVYKLRSQPASVTQAMSRD